MIDNIAFGHFVCGYVFGTGMTMIAAIIVKVYIDRHPNTAKGDGKA